MNELEPNTKDHQIESNFKKSKPRKKKKTKLFITIVVILILIFSIFGYLIYSNYLPFLIEIKEPVGNVEKKNTESYIKEYPEISDMPNLDKIDHEVFETDASNDAVYENYTNQLLNEGYKKMYDNKVQFQEDLFRILGFLKGLTAVAIIISLDNPDGKTDVVYATGNALDFQEVLEWYRNN